MIKEQTASWSRVVAAFGLTFTVGIVPLVVVALVQHERMMAVLDDLGGYGGPVVATVGVATAAVLAVAVAVLFWRRRGPRPATA